MGFADPQAQRPLGFGNGDEVEVVRHQAVGPNFDPRLGAPLFEQRQIALVVLILKKKSAGVGCPAGSRDGARRAQRLVQFLPSGGLTLQRCWGE